MPSNEGAVNGSALYRVLVIGGSYSGLAATLTLLDLNSGRSPRFSSKHLPNVESLPSVPLEIIIVDERDGYYHLIGNPLSFSSDDFSPKAWTRFDDIAALKVPNVRTIQGSVANIDCGKKVASILDTKSQQQRHEDYDYLVVCSGLRRTFPVVPQSLSRDEYLSEARKHTKAVRDAKDGVVVIGGGAVGIEMASEIKVIEPWQKVTLVHSRDKLLSAEPLPDDFKDRSLELLKETGVEVKLGQRVTDTTAVENEHGATLWRLTLADGQVIVAGHIITAISRCTPTTSFLPPAALDKYGYVKIDASLHFQCDVPNARSHFAAGDIISWSGIKRCGAAMHTGYLSAFNIHQDILERHLGQVPTYIELQEIPPMIALAVGKKAITYTPSSGTADGEDLMASCFGEDLGNTICWNYMKLGNEHAA